MTRHATLEGQHDDSIRGARWARPRFLRRARAFLALLPALAILLPVHGAGKTVRFRYRLQPGASYEQRTSMALTMDMKFEGMPEETLGAVQALTSGMEQRMEMSMVMYVGEAAEDGSMPVELRFEDVRSFMTMAGQEFEMPGLQSGMGSEVIQGRIGPDGRAIELNLDELTGLPDGMMDNLMQSMPSFPDKEMAVGDTFEMPVKLSMPIPQMAGQAGGSSSVEIDGKAVFELEAIGDPEARFRVTQIMTMGTETAEEEEPVRMDLEASGEGAAVFDLEEGIFTNLKMQMSMQMKMGMSGLAAPPAPGKAQGASPLSVKVTASGPVEITMSRTGKERS